MRSDLLSFAGISGRRRRSTPLNAEALESRLTPANVSIVLQNQTPIAGDQMYLFFAAGTTSGSGVTPVPWNIDGSGVATPSNTNTFSNTVIGSSNTFTLQIDSGQTVNGGRLYFGNSSTLVTWNGSAVVEPSPFAGVYFDYVEITMNVNGGTALAIDNSQVDGVGIPSQVTVTPQSAVAGGINEVGIVNNLTRADLFSGFQTAMQVTIGGTQPYLPFADLLQPDTNPTPISPDFRILSPQNLITQQTNATPAVQLNMQFVSQVNNGGSYSTTLTTTGTTPPTNGGLKVGQYLVGPGVPAGAVITQLPNFPTGTTVVVSSLLPFDQSVGTQLLGFLTPATTALNEWFGPYVNSTANINGTNAIDEFFTTWTQANPFRVEAKDSSGVLHIYEGYPTFQTNQPNINGGTSDYLVFQFFPTDSSTEEPMFYYPYFTTNSPGGKLYPVANGSAPLADVPPPPTGWSYLTPLSASQMIYGALGVFAMGTAADLNLQNMVAASMSRGTDTTWQTTWNSPNNVATLTSINGDTGVWTLDTTGLNLQVGMNVVSFKIFSTPMTITAINNGSVTVQALGGFGTTPIGFTDFLTFQNFYQQGQVFNAYAMYFHTPGVFIDQLAYAISYDDNGGFSTTITAGNVQSSPPPAVNITLTPWSASANPNDEYIRRLYNDVLHRSPEPAGLTYWVGLLNANGDRFDSAFGVVDSPEHFDDIIDAVYQKFLNRAPDPVGKATFRSLLEAGVPLVTLESIVLASPEYFTVSGGDNTGFINNVFQDVLGRNADPVGLAGYLAQLAAGVSRQTVALSILNSSEAHTVLVSGWYVTYLKRPADAAGLSGWVAALNAGAREQTVLEYLLASEEYYNL